MSKKMSIEEVKKIPPHLLLRVINKAKEFLKTDETMKKVFDEYSVDINEIDHIPTYFKDIDVSAKTDHGIVYLNYKLLQDGFKLNDYSYLIHEYSHWLQQCAGETATQSADDGDYLKNPFEQEGFQNQIEFISEHFGDDKAEDYVDNLLDHHDVESKKENKELKDILLSKV